MVATIFSGMQTTFNDTPTPAANKIITVKQWAEALEPRKTPFLTKIGFGDAKDQRPWYWGQSQSVPLETTLAEAVSIGETAIDLATGAGKYCPKGTVLEIIDFLAGSTTILDQSTREIAIVTDTDATDTVTVLKGQGGTSDVVHSSGAKVFIIGSAEIEGETTRDVAAVSRGFQFYNYFQRFSTGGIKADIAAQNMPTWEHPSGNPMMADLKAVTETEKVKLEKALWRGGRQAGSTTVPALMGGIDQFITTNVTNLAQAKITPNLIESELRDLVATVDGGAEGLVFLSSYKTASILDKVMNPIRQATATDDTLKLFTKVYEFRFGRFEVMPSHWCSDGVIYGIRWENLKVHPFKGADWHLSRKNGKDHGVDHDQVFLSGDFTFIVSKEASMLKLHSFNEDESVYQGYQTFNA